MMVEAASHFTGKHMVQTEGPMAQKDLDAKLQGGHPILMLVGDYTPYHVVSVGGCGNGKYYFHDPEWAAGDYQEYTYDQLLECPAGYKWLDTVAIADGAEVVVV
jgi:hypothetical protein